MPPKFTLSTFSLLTLLIFLIGTVTFVSANEHPVQSGYKRVTLGSIATFLENEGEIEHMTVIIPSNFISDNYGKNASIVGTRTDHNKIMDSLVWSNNKAMFEIAQEDDWNVSCDECDEGWLDTEHQEVVTNTSKHQPEEGLLNGRAGYLVNVVTPIYEGVPRVAYLYDPENETEYTVTFHTGVDDTESNEIWNIFIQSLWESSSTDTTQTTSELLQKNIQMTKLIETLQKLVELLTQYTTLYGTQIRY